MDITESPILQFEEIIKETDKAYQIKFSQTSICWLPKSQCKIIGKHIYLPQWLIDNNELGEFVYVK